MANKLGIDIFGGGKAEQASFNPFDGGTVQFQGNSHEDGGIDMEYEGNNVEVEGDETAVKDNSGDLHIMGNMRVPGTKTKFKQVSKAIAKQEKKYGNLMDKGTKLVDENNPRNKFEKLKFGTGKLMMEGATQGLLDLTVKKNSLSQLQTAMLDTAAEMGVDSIALSEGKIKQAKYGAKLTANDGKKLSLAERHNNPGNMKYAPWMAKYGAVKGEPGKDGGVFAKFPDKEKGLLAMKELLRQRGPGKGYKAMAVEQAIKTWTNNEPYNIDLGDLKGRKVGELNDEQFNRLFNVITQGEDSKTYNAPNTNFITTTPNQAPKEATLISNPKQKLDLSGFDPTRFTNNVSVGLGSNFTTQPTTTATPDQSVPDQSEIEFNTKKTKPAPFQSKFDYTQIAPELIAIADNELEAVPAQKYQPLLFQPYQQSFQDRMNRNTSTFNAIVNAHGLGTAALSTLAAQKYEADAAAQAEEFRVNQGISNQVYNQNIQLLNDAQLKNLQIADIQAEKQARAKSNTKAQLHTALSSIANKYIQHKRDNLALVFQQEMFDYRPVVDSKGRITGMEYQGPAYTAAPTGGTGTAANQSTTVKEESGNVTTTTKTPSDFETQFKELQNKRRNQEYLLKQRKLITGSKG